MYQYIRSKSKRKNTIGPFLKDGKILNEHPAEILRKQYESVFSKPSEKYKVKDPCDFFHTKIQLGGL